MGTDYISVPGLPIHDRRSFEMELTEGTGMTVDLSPDGRNLAFDLLGDVYVIPAKGGAATQITRGLAWDRRPVWSPDGNLLAYISDGTESDNVWVVEADGTNPRSVADEDEIGLEGAEWQRNGHRIVVARRNNVVSSLPLEIGRAQV